MVSGTGCYMPRACSGVLGYTREGNTKPMSVGVEPKKSFRSAPAIFAFFVENIGKAIRQEINRFTVF